MGDQSSAGFNNARTYTNNDLAGVRPPLRLFQTISLTGVTNANSVAVFENQFLVGQPGSPVNYKMFSRGGNTLWTQDVFGTGGSFRYVPALGGSLVILGGESTTSVKAVKISDGTVLWSDQVGNANGRFPAVTDNLAIYAGSDRIVARTLAGSVFWQQAVTTAATAIAVRDDSLYFLSRDRTLRAVNLMTGALKWAPVLNVASDGASLVASEKYLFVNDPAGGIVAAFSAATGQLAWNQIVNLPGTFATGPALALAYGRLYVFRANNGSGRAAISAYDADTGEAIWVVREHGEGLSHAFIADNAIYYYHGNEDIRVRDAATGTLIWSIPDTRITALTAANGELVALRPNAIDIYQPTNEIFMPHMANGAGQTTLIMLSNTGSQPATADVEFFKEDGGHLSVPLRSFGTQFEVQVTIPPNSSTAVQTLDQGGNLVSGWVRVGSTVPLHGTTNFQYSEQQDIVREAGVADAVAIGAANIFVSVGGGFNAGVAMANPTEQDAEVTLRLLNNSGIEVGSQTMTLESGGHVARFINEMFTSQVGSAFEGTLAVETDVPLAITAIRTKGGIQISSFPIGQAVR